ncbi:MAG: oleate hydratase [Gemmatimonadaceae bacterium]
MEQIRCNLDAAPPELLVADDDLVFVTNGSMTAASSVGSMATPATRQTKDCGGSWMLWETLPKRHVRMRGGPMNSLRPWARPSQWIPFARTGTLGRYCQE